MKSLPAIVSIATVAVLLLLAVLSSFVDSLPFAPLASLAIGFAGSVQFLAAFIDDYAPRSPRLIDLAASEAQAKREREASRAGEAPGPLGREARYGFSDPLTINVLATMGLHDDPSTQSLL